MYPTLDTQSQARGRRKRPQARLIPTTVPQEENLWESQTIGVTGLTDIAQVQHCLMQLQVHTATRPRAAGVKLAAGALVTISTLRGKASSHSRYLTPPIIRSIFFEHSRVRNLVHYSAHSDKNLVEALQILSDQCGNAIHGVQLNIPFLTLDKLEWDSRRITDHIRTFLFCSKHQDRSEEYSPCITRVIFDASGGTGTEFDPSRVIPVLIRMRSLFPMLPITISGGLCGENLIRLTDDIMDAIPGISFDAEGRLRDEHDQLVLHRVNSYIDAAMSLFDR
jgi:hypothetical protein